MLMMTPNSLECKLFEMEEIMGQLGQMELMLSESVAQSRRIDLVERELFAYLLDLGACLLKVFISQSGDGDLGQTVTPDEGKLLHRSAEKQSRRYQSIFGEQEIVRYTYCAEAKQKVLLKPLDQRLGLPEQDQSYLLEQWLQRMVLFQPYQEATESLKTLLGLQTTVRSAQRMNRDLAVYESSYQPSEILPEPDEELLVVSVDGKGVPMRRSLDQRKHEELGRKRYQSQNSQGIEKTTKRRTPGANKCTKQMAYVGAVYSIARFPRTTQQFLDDVQRKERQQDRPRPKGKRLSVALTQILSDELIEGPQQIFSLTEAQVADRLGERTLICLQDGQKSFWYHQRLKFPNAICILDLFHAMEYLWEAANCFHEKGSKAAENFVNTRLKRLLDGKVRQVIGELKRLCKSATASQQKQLQKVIRYYQTNVDHMQYDQYIKAGYPVGSGVIEGACRHFVKDRMERAGMRWNTEGATSILKLRAICLNGEWQRFMEHRITTEQKQLYANAA